MKGHLLGKLHGELVLAFGLDLHGALLVDLLHVVEHLKELEAKGAAAAGNGETEQPRAAPPPTSEGQEAKQVTRERAPAAAAASTPIEKPQEPSPSAKRLTLHFVPRSFKVEAEEAAPVTGFIEGNAIVGNNTKLVIRAYSAPADGALSEARRMAYYRAMMARKVLTERKVPPQNIQIKILDTPDQAQGSTVDIITSTGD